MDKDKRKALPPIPGDLDKRLSRDQQLELRRLENFGWRVAFVRRPLFQEILVVLTSGDGTSIAILEPDGQLNMEMDIKIRG